MDYLSTAIIVLDKNYVIFPLKFGSQQKGEFEIEIRRLRQPAIHSSRMDKEGLMAILDGSYTFTIFSYNKLRSSLVSYNEDDDS